MLNIQSRISNEKLDILKKRKSIKFSIKNLNVSRETNGE